MPGSFDVERLETLVDTLERYMDGSLPALQKARVGQGELFRGELVDPYGALPLLVAVAYDAYETAQVPTDRLPFPFAIQAEPGGLMHMRVVPNQMDNSSFALGALLITDVLHQAAERVDLESTNTVELDPFMPRLAANVPKLWIRSDQDAEHTPDAEETADLAGEHRASGS